MHRIFLKPQYKVYIGASIHCFNVPFFWYSLFFKNSSAPRLETTNGKQCCLPPLPFKISFKANINFYQTSDLNKWQLNWAKKISVLFRIKFKRFHTFSAYSNCCKLFVIISFYLLLKWCIVYLVLYYMLTLHVIGYFLI